MMLACSVWDLNGHRIHTFKEENFRVNDLAISPDGERLVVLLESRILVYDFSTYERLREWHFNDVKLTSVTISQTSRQMLVSMSKDTVKLMDIDSGEVIKGFAGHAQKQFVIRSAFGGADENFVVSGSEGWFASSPFVCLRRKLTVVRFSHLHMAKQRLPGRGVGRTFWLRE